MSLNYKDRNEFLDTKMGCAFIDKVVKMAIEYKTIYQVIKEVKENEGKRKSGKQIISKCCD